MRLLLLVACIWLCGCAAITGEDAAKPVGTDVHARYANKPKHAVLQVEVVDVKATRIRTGVGWASTKAEKVVLLVKAVPYRDEASSAFREMQPGREVVAMVKERMVDDAIGPIGVLRPGSTGLQ